ncbi:MAG: PH domain-containing protein [Bacteroidales bacterium]
MSQINFSQPRRQSAKGLILIFLQESRAALKAFWPVLLPVLLTKHTDTKWLVTGIFLLTGMTLLLIHTILYFLSYKFYIENRQFILKKGYLNRKTLTIPFERIQNVNTRQSLLQQLLGVMSLEIDTAGTDQKELKINSLTTQIAAPLALLLGASLEPPAMEQPDRESGKPATELLLKLTTPDLLRIGISQNHIKTALILFVLGIQFYYQIKEYFEEKAEEYANELLNFLSQSGLTIIAMLFVGFLVLSLLFSMIRTAVLFYDLRFYKLNQSYRIVSGLFTRKNLLLPFSKIQELNWETGPVRKLFGIYRVLIHQATGGPLPANKLIEIPGCLSHHIETIRMDLFGPDKLAVQPVIRSSKYYFRRSWIRNGWLPAMVASPLLLLGWQYAFLLVLWILYMMVHSWLTLEKSYFRITNDQIIVSSGAIQHQLKQMDISKVQHVEFRQGIFIRKRGLANLIIGNPAGTIRIPFIEADMARLLHDYLLYHAETSKNEWM